MKVVVADTGALISLGIAGQIRLIKEVFGEFYLAQAVWEELNNYKNPEFDRQILVELKSHVLKIKSKNHLVMIMDYGESESVILYEEVNADFLLIDDGKARMLAESLGVNCIGSIGLLIRAKQKDQILAVRPVFKKWIESGRYFSKKLLNKVLEDLNESPIQ